MNVLWLENARPRTEAPRSAILAANLDIAGAAKARPTSAVPSLQPSPRPPQVQLNGLSPEGGSVGKLRMLRYQVQQKISEGENHECL